MPKWFGSTTPKIAWNQNPEPDLAGYIIYWRHQPGPYIANTDVGLTSSPSSPQHTLLELLNPVANQRFYFFAITAYDSSGNESVFSQEVSFYISDPSTRTFDQKVIIRKG